MESSSASSLAELLLETHPHCAATTLEDSTRLFEDLEATSSTVNAQRTLHQQHQQHQQALASADLPFQLRAPLGGLAQQPAQAAAALQAQAGACFAFPAGDAQSESRARTERWIFANPGSTLFTPSGTSSVEARTTLPSTSFLTLQREATMEGPTAAVGGAAPRAATGDVASVEQRRSSPVTVQQQQQQQQQASAGPDVAAMASALSHLPPEQQQMLMHLGISDATILMQQQQQRTSSGQVNCSPPGSSSNVTGAADTTALAATATPADAAASLDAAETLWQQAVNNGTDDQTLLVLAAQLGLITTDAYGQAVLTRDILHQESSSSGPLPTSADAQAAAYAAASSGVSGFGNYGQAGAPALMLSSPTNLVGGQGFSAPLPRLPQQSTSSLEALLASVQSAGALGQLLASLGLGGGDLSRAGKNLGSPGPSKQHALYKTELCRGWLESGTCRYGAKCQFAHGREELRPVPRHPKYKTEICRSFAATGICAYGARCRFIHGAVSAPHNAIFFTDTSTAAGTSHPAVANLFNLTATATTATGLTGGTTLRPSDASLLASSSALHEGLEGVRGFDEDTFRTSAGSAHNKQQQQQLLQVPSLSQAQSGPLGLRQGAVLAQQQQQQREAARMAAMTQIMAARLLGVQQQQQQQLPSVSAGMSAGTASRVSLDSALSTGSYPLMGRSVRGAAGMGGGVSESQRMSLESMRHAAYGGGGASGSVFSGAHGGMGGYGMMSVPGTGTATGNRMSLESCMSQTTEGFIGQMGGGHPNQMELLRSSGEIQLMGEQGFAGRHQAGGGGGMYGNAAVLGGARSAGAGQGDAATALLQHLQQQGQHQQAHANIAAAMQQQHQQGAASTLPTWQPVLGMGPASSGAIQEAGGNKSVPAVPASLYAQQQQQQQQARAAANLWWEQQQQARGAEQQQQQGVPPHVSAYRSGLYSMGPAVGAGRPGAAVGGGARQPSPRLSHPGVVTPEMSETGLDPASDQRLGAMAAAAQR